MRASPPLERHPAIAATALSLPSALDPALVAVAEGRIEAATAERMGYRCLTASTGQAAPELAELAVRTALAEAGWAGTDVNLLVYAWIHHQGHDFWSPAHYIAQRVGARNAVPIGVQQMCNGGAAAIELALTRMIADPGTRRCVVTTADVFAGPNFDRWRGDYGVAYGDAATALLLDRDGHGPFRLLATSTTSSPELEAMHRGTDPFSPAPRWRAGPIDIRRTKKAYFAATGGSERFAEIAGEAVLRVVRHALHDADLDTDDPAVRVLALPRLGADVLDVAYRSRLGELGLPNADVLDLGRDTGHLGAGDAAANLADLWMGGQLLPGQVALLLSAGAGFTWSCIAVEAQ